MVNAAGMTFGSKQAAENWLALEHKLLEESVRRRTLNAEPRHSPRSRPLRRRSKHNDSPITERINKVIDHRANRAANHSPPPPLTCAAKIGLMIAGDLGDTHLQISPPS